jgi:hypothetical protein
LTFATWRAPLHGANRLKALARATLSVARSCRFRQAMTRTTLLDRRTFTRRWNTFDAACRCDYFDDRDFTTTAQLSDSLAAWVELRCVVNWL